MNYKDLLGVLASVAVAVERTTEVLKPVYLKVKNQILRKDQMECSKVEKNIMTIILGVLFCIIMQIGVDIPGMERSFICREKSEVFNVILNSILIKNIIAIGYTL